MSDLESWAEPVKVEGKHRFMAGTCVDCGNPLAEVCVPFAAAESVAPAPAPSGEEEYSVDTSKDVLNGFICAAWTIRYEGPILDFATMRRRRMVYRCDRPDGHTGQHVDNVLAVNWRGGLEPVAALPVNLPVSGGGVGLPPLDENIVLSIEELRRHSGSLPVPIVAVRYVVANNVVIGFDQRERQFLEAIAQSQRVMDLVRHQRSELLREELISKDEYTALAADAEGGQRVARLESYDDLRRQLHQLEAWKREAMVALSEREEWRSKLNDKAVALGYAGRHYLESACAIADRLVAAEAELVSLRVPSICPNCSNFAGDGGSAPAAPSVDIENYISQMAWSREAKDWEKTLVYGNLRAFWQFLVERGLVIALPPEVPVGMLQVSGVIAYFQNVLDRFGDSCVYIRAGGVSWGAVAMNRESADKLAGGDSPEVLLKTALKEHAEYCERVGPVVLKQLAAERKLALLVAAVEEHVSDGKHVGPRSAGLRAALEAAK